MARSIDNSEDYLDVRDIIARVEELRSARDDASESDEPELDEEDTEELATLEELLADLKGCGGDEQWKGDWYPVTLIRDSYFEESIDELLEGIGEIPKSLPPYLTITIDYEALRMDYSSVEYDGVTYWYR